MKLCQVAMEMFASLACMYVEANRLWTTAYGTFGRYILLLRLCSLTCA